MNALQQFWRRLTVPERHDGPRQRLLKLAARLVLFALLVTLVSAWLQLTPLRPLVQTWWGSLLLVLALYLPFYRWLAPDTLTPPPPRRQPGQGAKRLSDVRIRPTAAQRRKEKKRYAGVSKPPPKLGGRR